jgi:hypothetical protein
MPGWLKAFLIVAIVVVLLVAGAIAGGVYLLKWGKDALSARSKTITTEAADFGHQTDNQGCVNESMSRYRKEPGFTSSISTSIFLTACLDASRPTRGFCAEVPNQRNYSRSPEWRIEQCRHFDLASDKYCPEFFGPVQQFCERTLKSSGPGR